MVAPRRVRPGEVTLRNLAATGRRIGGLERRLSELAAHVLLTLQRIEGKVDDAITADQALDELIATLNRRLQELEERRG